MRARAMLLAAGLAASPAAEGTKLDTGLAQFPTFKRHFNKTYASAGEEARRSAVFTTNLRRVSELNKKETDAGNKFPPYGITSFMDVSPDEFRTMYLTGYAALGMPKAEMITKGGLKAPENPAKHLRKARVTESVQLNVSAPREFDVYSTCPSSDCSPIQEQGACGDCWAFTTTETLETQTSISGGGLTRLSPQELADCLTADCQTGGTAMMGFGFAETNGIDTLSSYPITSSDSGRLGSCNKVQTSTGHVSSYADGGSGDENAMLQNVLNHGPLTVAVDASNWQFYDGGRMSRAQVGGNPGCSMITSATCGTSIDHSVSVTGYTTVQNEPNQVTGWVIRNHWGEGWGCGLSTDEAGSTGGFAFIQAGGNVCDVAQQVHIVTA